MLPDCRRVDDKIDDQTYTVGSRVPVANFKSSKKFFFLTFKNKQEKSCCDCTVFREKKARVATKEISRGSKREFALKKDSHLQLSAEFSLEKFILSTSDRRNLNNCDN